MGDRPRGYQSPKEIIEKLLGYGLTKKDIGDRVGLTPWAIGKIVKNDSDTASMNWFKLKKIAASKSLLKKSKCF